MMYSAWLTLYMTGTRTYSRLMYSQNKSNMNRTPDCLLRLLRPAYPTGMVLVFFFLFTGGTIRGDTPADARGEV